MDCEDQIRQEFRKLFRRGEVADRLRHLDESDQFGRPASLFAPIDELLESELFAKVKQNPHFAEALRTTQAVGRRKDFQNLQVPRALEGSYQALFRLGQQRSSGAKHMVGTATGLATASPRFITTLPRISRFETFEDDLDCCAPRAGTQTEGGSPGTLLRVIGSGFSTDIADNIVRFGDALANVLYAKSDSLVVRVPFPGLLLSTDSPTFTTGNITVTIQTPNGQAATQFEIRDFEKVEEGAFERAMETFKRILAKLNGRLCTHSDYINRFAQLEETGGVTQIFADFPVLSAHIARGLNAITLPLGKTGTLEPAARRLLDGMTGTSGILHRMLTIEQELDDPLTNLLDGSGIIEFLCRVTRFLYEVITYVIMALLVVIVVFAILIIIGLAFGPAGIVVDYLLILLLIEIVKVFIVIITLLLVVETVVVVLYRVLQKLREWWEWLVPPTSFNFGE